jgi:hypothetical protein
MYDVMASVVNWNRQVPGRGARAFPLTIQVIQHMMT